MSTVDAAASRLSRLDVRALDRPAALIFNPNAGQKMGVSTNTGGAEAIQEALAASGVPFDPFPTEFAGHATALARDAVAQGRRLVIAAGGDGTAGEVAQGLVGTQSILGLMPLGSIMNVGRTLCIPRDLPAAAEVIAAGQVLTMDLGRVGETYFLEAAGVGLDAGLYGYFEKLDSKGLRAQVVGAAVRFLRALGTPRLLIVADGVHYRLRAPMVSVANGPYVGAAYAIAPDARIDDGLLDVVAFREAGVVRVLVHLLAVAGGRRLAAPPEALTIRARSVEIMSRRGRPLPVHADGTPIGATPIRFEVAPAALHVLVGPPAPDATCPWSVPDQGAPSS